MESDRLHQPAAGERLTRCRVERWRGYVSSSFYALTETGEVIESAPYRWWRAAPPPEDGVARAAYDSLVERLLAEGWEPEATGPTWYATSFVRRTFESPPVVVEAPPQPAPAATPAPRPARAQNIPAATVSREPAVRVERTASTPGVSSARWDRRRVMLAGALAGVVTFAGVAVVTAGRSAGPSRAPVVVHRAQAAKRPTTPTKDDRVAAAGARRQVVTTLQLRIAARSTTWLEIRRGSKNGRVLYSGNLSAGHALHFRGARLWARFGAAGNLTITQDGRPVRLQGTYDRLFVVRRSR